MKKYIIFISFIFVLIICYIFIINNVKSYFVEYNIDDFNIKEEYFKEEGYYSFILKKDDKEFSYIYKTDYRSDRKLVKKVDSVKNNDYFCIKPIIKNMKFNYICYDGEFKDEYVVGLKKQKVSDYSKKINNINVYNKNYKYYIWNGYGFTDLLNNKKYNFLKNESYDNKISLQFNNYIVVADYDNTRSFNKLYLFDVTKGRINEWVFKYSIDFDSYFMGEIDNKLYLFDRKNSKQYEFDIEEKKVMITSGQEYVKYFDNKWKKKTISECKYYDVFMNDNKIYNYLLNNDKLYLNINNINDILVSEKDIDDILYFNENVVYYLVDDIIYSYKYGVGEIKLLENFEWKFSYNNKVFIFN